MTEPTFVHIVHERLQAVGDGLAFRYVSGDEAETVSGADLDRRARAVAMKLLDRGLHGQRVLLLYPSGLQFIEAFLGCLYAGVIAVPAPLPAGQEHHVTRLEGIIRDAGVSLVLTVAEALDGVRELLAQAADEIPVDVVDDVADADAAAWTMPAIGPRSLALLQYTSGSTATPRGVRVSHANLVANERLIARRMSFTAATVSGGWLPVYHDMGLIGQVLQPLFAGAPATVMSPSEFLLRPHAWLRLIDRFGLELSGGPNFAYDLCVRRVTDEQIADLDLSRWRLAFNGAEPVRAATLRAFAERFAPAGFDARAFYPCYGMAETTLFVVGQHWTGTELEADAATRVASGRVEGVDVRIVDPDTAEVLPDGSVGEIWIRGGIVADGYWHNPDATRETFDAVTATGEGGFLRSGDLGALHGDELFVVGRRKELVIVNGRNFHPHDVEATVRLAHPALRDGVGAVFGVDVDGRDRLVVVHSLRRHDEAAAGEVVAAVRRHLGTHLGLAPSAVVLVRSRAILRTTSGKIQRTSMRRRFLDGELDSLYEEVDPRLDRQRRTAVAAS